MSMKHYKHLKIAIIIGFILFIFGCKSESETNKSNIKFASIYQESWDESSKNMYKIYLSMRKIDSLSAELNLKFTEKNSLGL